MCDCMSKLPTPFALHRHRGDVERCPSCDTAYKLTVYRRGTFVSKDWKPIDWWDLRANLRAHRIPKRWP